MIKTNPIYLDYNATTPLDPRVLEEMLPFFSDQFGNASSVHHPYGWAAEEAVERAKEQIANLIGAKAHEIYFTSGATEAVNLGLLGLFSTFKSKSHLITCATEHKAVLDTCHHLEKMGHEVSYLPVNAEGAIDLKKLEDEVKSTTQAICFMHANNETGVVHPLKTLGEFAEARGLHFFSDATQSLGKIELNVKELQIDLAAFSAHKLYGPKGVGAIYIRQSDSLKIAPQLFGGGQQKGIRPGTLNVPGIVGFGKACAIAKQEMAQENKRLELLKSAFENEMDSLEQVSINSSKAPRLPNTCNLTISDIDGSKLIRGLKRLAISQGSACNSGTFYPSHVLQAMGISDDLALSSIRVCLGRFTKEEEIQIAAEEIKAIVKKLSLVKA